MDRERWERIWEIFEGALERPAGERPGFLESACGEDGALRDEVESLLEAHESSPDSAAGDAIGGAVGSAIAKLEGASEPLSPVEGRRVGPYEIRRRLGRGGMGEVYLAFRADDEYRHEVAIKIARGGMDSPDLARRFLAERQILANLNHPNIARLLDGGSTDDGASYVVMEYVDGVHIDRYCESRRLPSRERVRIFRDVCAAVQYAHRNLVVHRDIKPGNILVTAEGVPKLLDFGIAKLLDPDSDGSTAPRTRTALRLLTPEYASPEQLRGGAITTSTDVYSLGVLLYELLTGRLPYRVDTTRRAELERAICETDPEKPSEAVSRQPASGGPDGEAGSPPEGARAPGGRAREIPSATLRRELRGDLDNIVLTALRKEPERRYASVEQLSDDLGRYLSGHPVVARKATWRYRASKFIRRNRWGVAAAATIAALLAGLAGSMVVQSMRIARARDRASTEAETAARVSGFMVDLFGGVAPEEALGREITAREILDRGVERISRELEDQPAVQSRLRETMGTVYGKLGLYDDAQKLLEASLRQRLELDGAESLEVAETRTRLGSLFISRGTYAEAERQLLPALEIRRRLLPKDDPDLIESYGVLGDAQRLLGHYDQAEGSFRKALRIAHTVYGESHDTVAQLLNSMGQLAQDMGHFAEAEQDLRQAIAMHTALHGEASPAATSARANLGSLLREMGRYDEAEQVLEHSVELIRKVYGDQHVKVATALNNLASLLKEKGDLAGAEKRQREALQMYRDTVGDKSYYVALSYNNLANILQDQGNLDEAERMDRKSLALTREVFGAEHPRVGDCLNNLANVLWEKHDLAGAERVYREALALDRKLLGPDHPYVAMDESNLSLVLRDAGNLGDALTLVKDAIAISTRAQGASSPTTGLYLGSLAALYLQMGRVDEAAEKIDEALRIQEAALSPDHWRLFQSRSIKGSVLAAQGKRAEAEKVLLESYEGLRSQLGARSGYTRRAAGAVARFYRSTGRPDRAAAYESSR